MKTVQVESYAGYRSEERPLRLRLGGQRLEISEVEDRWYSPGETYFRVVLANGDRYLLRHVEAHDVWSIEGFRRNEKKLEQAPGSTTKTTPDHRRTHGA